MRFKSTVAALDIRRVLEMHKMQIHFGSRWSPTIFLEHPYVAGFGFLYSNHCDENDLVDVDLTFWHKPAHAFAWENGAYAERARHFYLTYKAKPFWKTDVY
ncbi:MAG: hypothetical protein P8J32_07145 [bacterium]|nr:hypothetical protein [bacterium]